MDIQINKCLKNSEGYALDFFTIVIDLIIIEEGDSFN